MEAYFKSINRASKSGKIFFTRQYLSGNIGDAYSHLNIRVTYGREAPGGFSSYNTRGLNRVSKKLLSFVVESNNEKLLELIDMGAGAGVTAAQMFNYVNQNHGKRAYVDTVSLSPIAIDLQLCAKPKEMVNFFYDYVQSKAESLNIDWIDELISYYHDLVKWKVDPKIKDYDLMVCSEKFELIEIAMKKPWGISFNSAINLQELGYEIFKSCDPFIRKQYIGTLLDDEIKFDQGYDFIHDEWGAFHYTLKDSSPDQANVLINKVFSALKTDGVFYASHLRTNKKEFLLARSDIECFFKDEHKNSKSLSVVAIKKNSTKKNTLKPLLESLFFC